MVSILTSHVNILTRKMCKISYMSKEQTTGDRIRLLRTRLKLSQEALAAKVGVKRSAVTQWESGTSASLNMANIFKVARELNVSAEWLALGDTPSTPGTREDDGEYITNTETISLARRIRNLPEQYRAPILAIIETMENAHLELSSHDQNQAVHPVDIDAINAAKEYENREAEPNSKTKKYRRK